MKDNYITLKDKNGKKKESRILLNLEGTTNDVNYLMEQLTHTYLHMY